MNWLISANPSVYDHYSSFMENGYIDWHQTANYAIGDIVYIYSTAPVKMIRFKTVVVAIGMIFDETTDDKKFWKDISKYERAQNDKYCRLIMIEELYNEKLSLPFLLQNGLSCAPQRAQRISKQLNDYISRILNETADILLENVVDEFGEGRQQTKQHIVRERNPMLVREAKQKFKREHGGKLYCEICGFDFSVVYGDIGEDYIEIHHIKPISKMKEGERTNLNDVAVICSNCHRIIHRKKPWLTIEQVKKCLETTKNNKYE